MRSVGELANDYERWADEDEAVASKIMSNASSFPEDRREKRLREASILAAQAESFREHAARLRSSRVAVIEQN